MAKDIITENDLEDYEPIQAHTVGIQSTAPEPQTDRINNTKQKESALHKAGVSRYKAFLVVARSLEAKKLVDEIDNQGNVKSVMADDVPRQQWAAEMVAKYFGDFVTKTEDNGNGIRQLIIIRPGADSGPDAGSREASQAQGISRPVRFQSEALSRDVQLMGHGKDDVIDISGNAIQRADTE